MTEHSLGIKLAEQERVVRVIYIGSYIPRECGIATYTKDLTTAINVLNPLCLSEIMAIDENGNDRNYPWEVKYKIRQDDLDCYTKAAEYINQSSADVVHIQHEFGIFGGKHGEYIIPFMQAITKPIITTLHTVLDQPDEHRKKLIQEIAELSTVTIVMIKAASDRLNEVYGIAKEKIVVIPHGVPDIPYGPTLHYKKELGYQENMILSTFGLINPGKGIEYVLEALPEVVKKFSKLKFLIIGATHPVLVKREGEKYREKLQELATRLGLNKNVEFINRYLSLDEVVQYLRATDIYISPYLQSEQIASGTLAYALGAGRACISTEYLYAKEVLADGRGILVPFRDPQAMTEKITELTESAEKRNEIEKKAYSYGRTMIWSNVALKHLNLFWLIARDNKAGSENGDQS
ncbi:MAG: glycosyltransferase family 4 protein [bacterium]|nr:glycosyltransferase family 4 protein [bacterium]